jgi:uncharacterized protein (DUF433 family)
LAKCEDQEKVMFDRITFDSQIMGGRACLRGMRIPVSVIVGQIAHGATWDEVLQGYPDLEREDIQQALEYAAWLTHEEVRTAWRATMRFLADMGVSQQVVEWLRAHGHDAVHLRDEGLQRLPNDEIFQKAGRE